MKYFIYLSILTLVSGVSQTKKCNGSNSTNPENPTYDDTTLCSKKTSLLTPPIAKRVEFNHIYHGQQFPDAYNWLRDEQRTNPEVLNFLKQENKYAENLMEPLQPLANKIFNELVSRVSEDDVSVPIKSGDYQYYTKEIRGKQYPIRIRKYKDEKEEVLLDLNTFDGDFLSLGEFKVSNKNDKGAYTLDTKGNEIFDLYIKDFNTNETKKELSDITSYIAWSTNDQYLFYLTYDEIARPYRLYRHKINTAQNEDVLLYEEKDLSFYMEFDTSVSGKYLFLNIASQTASEFHFVDLDKPELASKVVSKRIQGRIYSVEHQQDNFIIITNQFNNQRFMNFRLLKTKISDYENESKWQAVIPYEKDILLNQVYAIKDYILLKERYNGFQQVRIISNNGEVFRIKIDEPLFFTEIEKDHLIYDSKIITFSYSSLITPKSTFNFDVTSRNKVLLKQDKVLGGFNSDHYQMERLFVEGRPISIVYKKGMLKKDGSNPLHLYGYGSYGAPMEPSFKPNVLPLLERGFIYAIAHIRGGSEMGWQWYELEGKLLAKKNTFTDFINAAKALINLKYTSASLLSIEGRSAGGLLMGAVVNYEPSLFNAVISGVPFVDVINTMFDPNLLFTVLEYEEWGNPNNKTQFDYMLSYSPYENLPKNPKHFPHILMRSGLNDFRVNYWEPAKYGAKIRKLEIEKHPKPTSSNQKDQTKRQAAKLLQIISMGSGHSGSSGKYDKLKDVALDYAFLIATAKRICPFH